MKLKYEFEIMEMDDQILAIPVGDNSDSMHGIVKLNRSGADIIQLLQNEVDENYIVDSLIQEYDVSRNELIIYVKEFIDMLKRENLIA